MKKYIALIISMILFAGCTTTTRMISLSDSHDLSKSEIAWSRANAYLIRYSIKHITTKYTMKAEMLWFPLIITREIDQNSVKFRFTSYYEIFADVMGPDPHMIRQAKRQEEKIRDLMNYMKTGLSKYMEDVPLQTQK